MNIKRRYIEESSAIYSSVPCLKTLPNEDKGCFRKFKMLKLACIISLGILTICATSTVVSILNYRNCSVEDSWGTEQLQIFENYNNSNYLLSWNERDIDKQFPSFEYAGNTYIALPDTVNMEKSFVDKEISELKMKGFDTIENIAYEINAKLFSIKDVSLECCSALMFDGHAGYYIYGNPSIVYEDFESFCSKISVFSNIDIDLFDVIYEYTDKKTQCAKIATFKNYDKYFCFNQLFKIDNVINLSEICSSVECFTFRIKYKGIENTFSAEIGSYFTLSINSKDEIIIRIFNGTYSFGLPKKRFDKIKKHLFNDSDGFILR